MREGVEAWLRAAAQRVRVEAPALTALDQAIGDGDHGINLDRGFTAIVAMLDERRRRRTARPTPPRRPTSCARPARR